MAVFFEWVKKVMIYLIIVHAVLQLLPGEKYEKYVRFFTGLVLIVLLSEPLFHLFDIFTDMQELQNRAERAITQVDAEQVDVYYQDLDLSDFLQPDEQEKTGG